MPILVADIMGRLRYMGLNVNLWHVPPGLLFEISLSLTSIIKVTNILGSLALVGRFLANGICSSDVPLRRMAGTDGLLDLKIINL